ncbi:MAG: glucose 1-dehydrogenase [Proteobacteria bacterium]|nr:glucose 1-dehydrogenase [Pseudomonadota bacterium]
MNKFEGKIALVTGAASGIGAATATAFAREGAAVVLADIQVSAGDQLAASLRDQGHEARFVKSDITIERDVENMVAVAAKTFGRLDYAANCAGIESAAAPITQCTNENWDRTISINLRGIWWCMKYEIPEMVGGGGGAIVNCASIAGLVAFPGLPAYVASKHGVIGLTKNAALEFADKNIRVNAICPGVIHTPMIDRITQGDAQAERGLKEGAPMGRMGTAEEIAETALWLCSNGSSFVTGHALVADGGWVAR